ncbi:PEP-CTERM sorting domain-containing protein [Prosthecobacter sp.]|uniref:PEP-CTERM sorting domain-containing protein n=1 Tax=Prosthecobacter sp. TaxID=1965333 RepID=UPI002AB9A085|nr:PEP-CTERM sorting domain-containing protein [Prosthecobacter sp.]MDZ4404483.1 PEP-CTERM sorting domain-containing protein [Prosthecobacter sp.]
MNRLFALVLSLTVFTAYQSHASISFLVQSDLLKNSGGTAMIQTGLVLFVSSTTDATFDSILAGSSTSIGSSLNGGDDKVLFKTDLSSYGVNGVLDLTTGALDLSSVSGWNTGDPLALLWFPTLTTASSTIGAGTEYGFYRNGSAVDSTQAWVTPADPTSNYLLGFFTQDGAELSPGPGAANTASAGNASLTVAGVPEPSRSLLGLIGFGVLVLRRRR